MVPQTFIFIGRSGCGKGTQAAKLKDYLANLSTEGGNEAGALPVFYIETGRKFRDFIAEDGYTNKLSRNIIEVGGRQPDFLAVWLWAGVFVANVRENEHWILDGFPRSAVEAPVLNTAMKFYRRNRPNVVYINVSRKWSFDRLKGRGRSDDADDAINKRLNWFDTDVMPAIEYYRANPDYNFLEINGEQTIDEVWAEIASKIKI